MSLESVAYTSSAVQGLTDAGLEALLSQARVKNVELEVTGVLLYHDGSFLQYYEGPPASVAQVNDRVRRSPLHHGIIELMHGPIEQRCFPDWLMGFTHAPASAVLRLSNASWKTRMNELNASTPGADSDGLDLLLQFWASNRGPRPQ